MTPANTLLRNKRILLLVSPSSYRAGAFVAAAERLGLEVVQGIDLPTGLADHWNVPLGVDFNDRSGAVDQIVAFATRTPVDAIISVDDAATLVAAEAASRLGLRHNSPHAALSARDKLPMRQAMAAHGVPVPRFESFPANRDPDTVAQAIAYSCVVKPSRLSGSRGVIRANDPEEFSAAVRRIQQILEADGTPLTEATILVEEFIPGIEVAVEGLMNDGAFQLLALFDKPDPLDGPFFEETIYTTPSRHPGDVQTSIATCVADAARSLGLSEGPIHAELRFNERGPFMLEVAGRSIGGLCSTVLEFGTGLSLEEIILSQAVGEPIATTGLNGAGVGVMMIPIPKSGILREVDGVDEAAKVPGITGVEITVRRNHRVIALPEGASYLGFIFAKSDSPAAAESALRQAHARLRFRITPEIALRPGASIRAANA